VKTFGGVEALLIGWLPGHVRFLTDTPADLATGAGRAGGPDRRPVLGRRPVVPVATVSVDCFAADRVAATVLAQQVDDALRKALPGHHCRRRTVTKVAP
jgi:hypothetical protein